MEAILDFLQGFNPVTVVLRLFLAMVFGGIIGLERGKQGRAAGMRTHILVCLGATVTTLIGQYCTEILELSTDPMRIAAQVISGIGFLGVGTILIKGRFQITGLTTAAGIWTAAVIGLALGIGFYEGAIVTFFAEVLVTTILHRLEYRLTGKNARFGIYVEINSCDNIRKVLDHIKENYPVTDMQVTHPRSGHTDNVGIEANVHAYNKEGLTPDSMAKELEMLDAVVFAIESL